jgi:hypothetical protein
MDTEGRKDTKKSEDTKEEEKRLILYTSPFTTISRSLLWKYPEEKQVKEQVKDQVKDQVKEKQFIRWADGIGKHLLEPVTLICRHLQPKNKKDAFYILEKTGNVIIERTSQRGDKRKYNMPKNIPKNAFKISQTYGFCECDCGYYLPDPNYYAREVIDSLVTKFKLVDKNLSGLIADYLNTLEKIDPSYQICQPYVVTCSWNILIDRGVRIFYI